MSRLLLTGLLTAVLASPATADKLLVDKVRATDNSGPDNGSTMAQVQQRYGDPAERKGPVGEPPIRSWRYPEFTVYFEGRRVIHTVARD